MSSYDYGMVKSVARDPTVFYSLVADGLSTLIEVVKSWPANEFHDILIKLQKLRPDFEQKLRRHVNRTPTAFSVLNHGDLWVNNILFKYNEKKPIDVVFVDYQMVYYSSPGIDTNFFLCTSPMNNVREKCYDTFIDIYCQSMLKTLKERSNAQIPSLVELKDNITSREFYGNFIFFLLIFASV